MFLLKVIDLLALTGLLVQAFLAWVFVAVLASVRDRDRSPGPYRSFRRAFVALALALTVLSVRFFRAHDVESSYDLWADGRLAPTLCYAAYMALKAVFALHLVAGSHQLGSERVPGWLSAVGWPLVAAVAAAPFVLPAIDTLLVLQAPLMVGASLAALRALPAPRAAATGVRTVRAALVGLAASWTLYAVAALVEGRFGLGYVLALNSFIDIAVQLMLGIGLIACLLQDSHGRRLEAEREHERLRRAVEKDEKLRALGTVVSGVAHELNNPLTVILGYAEVLQQGGAGRGAETGEGARIIAEQAERCHGIVRNLSALAGQAVHPREDVDLEDLALRVVRGLAPEATADGRRVRVEPLGGLRASVDRIGLEQVLANLIANGLHASPPGGTVTVGARATAPGTTGREGTAGRNVELWVTDEGPGVPLELRERLFEPFFTTKAPGKGTGLGLSIAHAIVRGHGGSVAVEDGPDGRGARFRVTLPDAVGRTPAPAAPPAEPRREGRPRLLVVDDDAAVRAIVRAQAERRGWDVEEAGTAEEALERTGEGWTAVLCDLRMPGIGGAGFHDRLVAAGSPLLERVVYVTGDVASAGALSFAARCGRPLLPKPFDFGEVFAMLASVGDSAPGDLAGAASRVS